MFIARVVTLILATLWLWPSSLYAQSEALMNAYNQGQALKDAGRYEQAIPFWRKAFELGEQEFGPNHETTAILLNNLAELYRSQGRYKAAEPLYKRALAIDEKALGPDHPSVAMSLGNLAELYRTQGRFETALMPRRKKTKDGDRAAPLGVREIARLADLVQLLAGDD